MLTLSAGIVHSTVLLPILAQSAEDRIIPVNSCVERHKGECVMDYRDIITLEPGKRGGQPTIRGMRITVYDVLEYLGAGMSEEQLLADFPYLTKDDVLACLQFAANPLTGSCRRGRFDRKLPPKHAPSIFGYSGYAGEPELDPHRFRPPV